jgi:hypothetical protein
MNETRVMHAVRETSTKAWGGRWEEDDYCICNSDSVVNMAGKSAICNVTLLHYSSTGSCLPELAAGVHLYDVLSRHVMPLTVTSLMIKNDERAKVACVDARESQGIIHI